MKKRSGIRISRNPEVSRRTVLGLIGGSTAATLVGCLRGQSVSSEPRDAAASSTSVPGCVIRPEQTEGPYFVDERLNRTDIRSDPSNGSMKAGVPLQLAFQVTQVSGSTCSPIADAIVDVWHCDAEGIYSDVRDRRLDTTGKKFLRGYQVTDTHGMAQFTTIYPGYYPGRAVHIHFKIRTDFESQQGYEFTSQLYFDDELTDRIYAQSPYSANGQRTLNRQDGLFQNGGEQLIVLLEPSADGYRGDFRIALEWA